MRALFSPPVRFSFKAREVTPYAAVSEEVPGPGLRRLGGWPPTCYVPALPTQAERPRQGCQGSWKAHPHLPQPSPLPTWGRAPTGDGSQGSLTGGRSRALEPGDLGSRGPTTYNLTGLRQVTSPHRASVSPVRCTAEKTE